MTGFKVYWSKRGHYTASSTAGAGPGAGNGEIESCGESPGEAVANLQTSLIQKRKAFQAKIAEIEEALEQIRYTGHNAEDLLLLPKEGEIGRKKR